MREKLNSNPLAQLAVVGVLLLFAAVFVMSSMGGGEEKAEEGEAASAAAAVEPAVPSEAGSPTSLPAVGTGVDARASRDAGSYLCNYLSWRAIEAVNTDSGPRLAAFIHIPPLARGGAVRRKGFSRITLDELVDAGEAMLMEMVRLARRAS